MKPGKLILWAVLLLSISACCAKRKCASTSNLLVEFNNFTAEEADTVLIIAYLSNSGFSSVVDTTLIPGAFPVTAIGTGIEHDYRIVIPGTGQVFEVSGFETKKAPCG